MTDNKEMTIEERAEELYPVQMNNRRAGGEVMIVNPYDRNKEAREIWISGFTSCQQLYGGLTPEQLREAVKFVRQLLPLAEDGLKSIIRNGTSHQEFISDDREMLRSATKFLSTLSKDETPKQ